MPTIPSLDQWLKLTSKGLIDRRSARLRRIDTALWAYENSRYPMLTLKPLAKALRDYKQAKHGWFHSVRNQRRALSDLSAGISGAMEAMKGTMQPLRQDYIWCPYKDADMQRIGENMIANLGLHPTLHTAGDDLSMFSVSARLYILAHGHTQMPLFITKFPRKSWTADELAGMLLDCGLSTEIRSITMLVCHAGESVNTVENSQRLMDISALISAAKAAADKADEAWDPSLRNEAVLEQVKLRTEFLRVASDAREPRFYERKDNSEEAIDLQSKQLLPLAAQLSAAMRKLGFSDFALESYKAPVTDSATSPLDSSGMGAVPGIRLNLSTQEEKNPSALASAHRKYWVLWR